MKAKLSAKTTLLKSNSAILSNIRNPTIAVGGVRKSHCQIITQVNTTNASLERSNPVKLVVRPTQKILPPQSVSDKGKKTLILDLDETLVHSSFQPLDDPDLVFPVHVEGETFYVYVAKRPGVDLFLSKMHKMYEIVVYTASLSLYADPLLDLLDSNHLISHRLFREHCTLHNGAFVKDLALVGRDLKSTIIVDNSPAAYLFQPENAIPIPTWIDDLNDQKLQELLPVLELLAHFPDVRKVIPLAFQPENSVNYAKAETKLKELAKTHQKQKINYEVIQKIMQFPLSPQMRLQKKIMDSEKPFHSIKQLVTKMPSLNKLPHNSMNAIMKPGTPTPYSFRKLLEESGDSPLQIKKGRNLHEPFRPATPKGSPKKRLSLDRSGKKDPNPLERKSSGMLFNLLRFKPSNAQLFVKPGLPQKLVKGVGEAANHKLMLYTNNAAKCKKPESGLITSLSLTKQGGDSDTSDLEKTPKRPFMGLPHASSPFLLKVSQVAGQHLVMQQQKLLVGKLRTIRRPNTILKKI